MFLTQLEYREKPTATNWKRICFPQKVTLVSEDTQLPVHLLHIIAALPAFGRNQAQHGFADAISRMTFQAAHSEYMWFAKSTTQDGALLIDEEELYDQDSNMLMRRAFGKMTLFASLNDETNETIPVNESMLAQHPELEVLQKLQQAFQRVTYHKLTDDTAQQILSQLPKVQHGTLILLDGSQLSAPLDVSALAQRNDVQIIATGCSGLTEMTITKKGKMISCV